MSNPEFSITSALESYFHPLTPRPAGEEVDKVNAFLIIASYFTVIIPFACGIVYACNACSNTLRGRVIYLSADRVVVPEALVPLIPASARRASLLTHQQLHEELEAWVASEGGRSTEAAARIESAYRDHLTTLDLSNLRLITLPAVIGKLQRLERLLLAQNQLTTFPAEMCQLHQLKRLDLRSNQLIILPHEIGQLQQLEWLDLSSNKLIILPVEIGHLVQLEELILCSNHLTTLPAQIGQLLRLKKLYLPSNRLTILPPEIGRLLELQDLRLYSNQLITLPPEIGQLLQLRRLELQNNPALSALPVAFGNLSGITELDISRTSIPPAQQELFFATVRRHRNAGAVERLPQKLELWKGYAQMSDLNLDIRVLAQGQKEMLHEWLVRLETAQDFQRSQQSLCETACRMLNTVLTDRAFRETFFVQVRENLEACGDRAAMSFNEIYTAWVLATLSPQEATHRKLAILKGIAKTNTLRSCLQKIIGIHERKTNHLEQESVEIYLYYENILRVELSLVSAIQNMLHARIGRRDWIDAGRLAKQVTEAYLDTLIEIPAFDALIRQDQAFMVRWTPVEDQFQEQLERLQDDCNSADYVTRSGEILEERNLAWKAAAIRWAQSN